MLLSNLLYLQFIVSKLCDNQRYTKDLFFDFYVMIPVFSRCYQLRFCNPYTDQFGNFCFVPCNFKNSCQKVNCRTSSNKVFNSLSHTMAENDIYSQLILFHYAFYGFCTTQP